MSTERRKRFFGYFRNELDLVDGIGGREYKVHKKLVYVALLDTMAGLVFPRLRNRRRFVELVKEFGAWSEWDKISTPHLVRALELNPAPQFNEVRNIGLKHLASWSQGELKKLKDDLDYNVVRSKWPKDKESSQPLEGVALESLQHVQLLYSFRNAVVHSFRPLGTDFEMPEDVEPYYLSVSDSEGESPDPHFHWDLIYPAAFFRALTESVFDNVERHTTDNEIDPIEVLKRGRYWLDPLNR